MDIHEMAGQQDGDLTIWICPLCGREVWTGKLYGLVIMEQGDPSANHRGGMGGLTIGAVAVSEIHPERSRRIEDDGPFEQWAGENAERLFKEDSDEV